MSAILRWMTPNSTSGVWNCLRSLAYLHRELEALARRAERAGAELQAADVQDVERDLVAVPELAEEVLGGHDDVLEDQLARSTSP